MSGISALGSVAQTWLTQKVNGAKNGDGDKDGLSVSGTNGSQQGGAFMQDVMQSLQSLGLNLQSSTGTPAATDATQGVSATSSDVGHALHTFMHDLHQSLRQSGVAQQSPSTDSSSPSTTKNGYSDFASNLQNLIGSLNSGTPATTSTDPAVANAVNNITGVNAVNGATETNATKLQSDFSNLLSAIGSGSGSTSSTTPTLQDFLNKMESNVNKTGRGGAGSIFSAQV